MFFDITTGNSSNYFVLNGTTGILTLNQTLGQNVPLGVYPLTVRVRDAYLSSSNPPDLQNALPEYATMQTTCSFTITVGPEMVPPYYQGGFQSDPIWTQEANTIQNPCQASGNQDCNRMGYQSGVIDPVTGVDGTGVALTPTSNNPQYFGIGGFYFGPRQNGGPGTTPLIVNGTNNQAPSLGSGEVYNMVSQVEGDIGGQLGLTPVALTSGAMVITVNLENVMDCPSSDSAIPANNSEIQYVKIFHRAASTTAPNPNSWVQINDANAATASSNLGASPAFDLKANVVRSAAQTSANACSTLGVFYIDANQLPGEYFIAVKTIQNLSTSGSQGCCACNGQSGIQGTYQGYSYITAEDANFDFTGAAQDQGVLYSYPYTVQQVGGTTSTFPNTSLLPIGAPTDTVYAHAKYGNTVRQFFSDSSLLTPWEPNQGVQGDLYHTFEGGLIQNFYCVKGGNCQAGQEYWTVNDNPATICGSSYTTWSPPSEPLNMRRASKVVYKGKFSATGEVVNGYTISDPSYAADSTTVILAQSFDGTGSVNGPTDVKSGGIPVTRFAGMSGSAADIC